MSLSAFDANVLFRAVMDATGLTSQDVDWFMEEVKPPVMGRNESVYMHIDRDGMVEFLQSVGIDPSSTITESDMEKGRSTLESLSRDDRPSMA